MHFNFKIEALGIDLFFLISSFNPSNLLLTEWVIETCKLKNNFSSVSDWFYARNSKQYKGWWKNIKNMLENFKIESKTVREASSKHALNEEIPKNLQLVCVETTLELDKKKCGEIRRRGVKIRIEWNNIREGSDWMLNCFPTINVRSCKKNLL